MMQRCTPHHRPGRYHQPANRRHPRHQTSADTPTAQMSVGETARTPARKLKLVLEFVKNGARGDSPKTSCWCSSGACSPRREGPADGAVPARQGPPRRTGSVNILLVGLEYTIRVVTCVLG